MTEQEFKYWTAKTHSSANKWTEDEIYRLNGKGLFYYLGGEDGIYLEIEKDGLLSAGTYEGAFPHIGEAFFCEKHQKQHDNQSVAFAVAAESLGTKFLADMFSSELSFEEFMLNMSKAEDKTNREDFQYEVSVFAEESEDGMTTWNIVCQTNDENEAIAEAKKQEALGETVRVDDLIEGDLVDFNSDSTEDQALTGMEL